MNALRDDIILLTAQELKYGVNVGLDGALISIDNIKNELEYCGANIPLYIQRAKELIEYSSNRFSLSLEGNFLEDFESQTIALQEGDVIYIASDGIRDQFGGEKGKKLKKKGFEQLLIDAGKQPFDQRSNYIKSFMKTWQGDNFQVDDQSIVCIEYQSQKLF
jgi:serine phosphatase RsbU (regulator of sigma subunit)